MKIVKTHHEEGFFQIKKVNSFFAVSLFVAGV